MPDLEPATIMAPEGPRVSGRGFVEITTQDGVKKYNGVLEADRQSLRQLANSGTPLEFEGAASDARHHYRITLPIEITHFDSAERAIFKERGGPSHLEAIDLTESEGGREAGTSSR
ncbi:MAG TPA: hypothetical protein VF171_05605 [Trueperaceae bacterium]